MRTTLTLDDEAAMIAANYAKSRELTLSKAVSELIVRGTRRKPRITYEDGFPVFDLGRDEEAITAEQVEALEAEEE
jgi:hypothetical protein